MANSGVRERGSFDRMASISGVGRPSARATRFKNWMPS
jgi:hypothetical protein